MFILPKITNEQLAALKAKVTSKAIKKAAEAMKHNDHFADCANYALTAFSQTKWVKPFRYTDAARLIAAMPPIRFPVRLANRLGDRCLRELGKIEGRQ